MMKVSRFALRTAVSVVALFLAWQVLIVAGITGVGVFPQFSPGGVAYAAIVATPTTITLEIRDMNDFENAITQAAADTVNSFEFILMNNVEGLPSYQIDKSTRRITGHVTFKSNGSNAFTFSKAPSLSVAGGNLTLERVSLTTELQLAVEVTNGGKVTVSNKYGSQECVIEGKSSAVRVGDVGGSAVSSAIINGGRFVSTEGPACHVLNGGYLEMYDGFCVSTMRAGLHVEGTAAGYSVMCNGGNLEGQTNGIYVSGGSVEISGVTKVTGKTGSGMLVTLGSVTTRGGTMSSPVASGIEVVSGGRVTVGATTVVEGIGQAVLVADQGTAIIDNGSFKASAGPTGDVAGIRVRGGGQLQVTNQAGQIFPTGSLPQYGISVEGNSSARVTINGGEIQGTSRAINSTRGETTITGGKIDAPVAIGVSEQGKVTIAGGSIGGSSTVNTNTGVDVAGTGTLDIRTGAVIFGRQFGVAVENGGSITMSGGIVTGQTHGVSLQNVNMFSVSNGEIFGTDGYGAFVRNGNTEFRNNVLIRGAKGGIYIESPVSLTVNGGTYKGEPHVDDIDRDTAYGMHLVNMPRASIITNANLQGAGKNDSAGYGLLNDGAGYVTMIDCVISGANMVTSGAKNYAGAEAVAAINNSVVILDGGNVVSSKRDGTEYAFFHENSGGVILEASSLKSDNLNIAMLVGDKVKPNLTVTKTTKHNGNDVYDSKTAYSVTDTELKALVTDLKGSTTAVKLLDDGYVEGVSPGVATPNVSLPAVRTPLTFTVTVEQPVDGLSIIPAGPVQIIYGEKLTLTGLLTPEDSSDIIEWKVASGDQSALKYPTKMTGESISVTAGTAGNIIGTGEVVLMAVASKSKKSDTIQINVVPKPTPTPKATATPKNSSSSTTATPKSTIVIIYITPYPTYPYVAPTYPVIVPGATLSPVHDDSNGGLPSRGSTSFPFTGTVRVYTYLNVRALPNADASIIGALYDGDTVNVVGQDGEWYQVEYAGGTAYVHSRYISSTGQSRGSSYTRSSSSSSSGSSGLPSRGSDSGSESYGGGIGDAIVANCFSVNVRSSAGMGNNIINWAMNGDRVEVLSREGNWCRVIFRGKPGYIYSRYIQMR